ncbi:MAG: lipoprotein-releasing ABC transporter permease subunit [Pseudomonadota bacterium]
MNVSFFIGLRYLFTKRQESFTSLMSRFSFIGIVLGVVSLIVVLSVMNGFHAELRSRILTLVPHAFVDINHTESAEPMKWSELYTQLSTIETVEGAAPYIQGKAMLSFNQSATGVTLNGVLPEYEKEVSVVHEHMMMGEFNALMPGSFGVVIGHGLASQLNANIGDMIKLTIPKVSITPAGIFPRMRSFEVLGVFKVGAQLDHDQVFVHIEDAQRLQRYPSEAQGLRVRLDEAFSASQFADTMSASHPDQLRIKTWQQTHKSLFSAIKMEKTLVSFLLAAVIGVAAFNIISILSIMISNKTSEIAVLRTMGATPRSILLVFLSYGLSMALLGMLIGTLIALPMAHYIGSIVSYFEGKLGVQVFDASIYYISKIPSEIHWQDVVFINVLTFTLVLLASIYPAYKATQVEPAQALQYE